MANQEHLDILKQGVEAWNKWRREHPDIKPDLSGADLNDADLNGADLRYADLNAARLNGAYLERAIFHHGRLNRVRLNRAHLNGAGFFNAELTGAYFEGADLTGADLSKVNLEGAHLTGANLSKARLSEADLRSANFHSANLEGAYFEGAYLVGSHFGEANLSKARLNRSVIVGVNFRGANLNACSVYGVAAWDVHLEGAQQLNLVITPDYEPTIITVDNLKIAQFIYLLLNNAEIRDAIDTIGKKAVLLLGRFTPERKAVLDALRAALRAQGYVPIVFDFDKPSSQDLTETVTTLAHLSRFIIADLTDPSSIPYELHVVIPNRMVPVLPLLKASIDPTTGQTSREFAMFGDLRRKYHWVLPTHTYNDLEDLLASLEAKVIGAAEQKAQELAGSDTRLGSSDAHTMSP